MTASRRWILASSWQRDAWLIDRAGGEARLFQAAEVEEDHSAEMALNPSGDEILVLDRNALVLHRYALP